MEQTNLPKKIRFNFSPDTNPDGLCCDWADRQADVQASFAVLVSRARRVFGDQDLVEAVKSRIQKGEVLCEH